MKKHIAVLALIGITGGAHASDSTAASHEWKTLLEAGLAVRQRI